MPSSDEIAGLIDELGLIKDSGPPLGGGARAIHVSTIDRLAAALRENEILQQNVQLTQASFLRSCTRIRELEAELNREKESGPVHP